MWTICAKRATVILIWRPNITDGKDVCRGCFAPRNTFILIQCEWGRHCRSVCTYSLWNTKGYNILIILTLLFSSSRLIPVYFVITRREQNDISALLYMHMNICINIDDIYIIINIRYRTCWGSEGRGIRLCYRDAPASLKIYWWKFVQRFKSV